jgi:hypothetical protein
LSDMGLLPSNVSRGVPLSREKLRRNYALTRESDKPARVMLWSKARVR